MATKIYLTNANSDYNTGTNDARLDGTAIGTWAGRVLSTSVGSGLFSSFATPTVAGPTNGLEAKDSAGTASLVWYSAPLDAAVTISGSITWNIWAAESSSSANVAINGRLEKVDGATGAITLIDATARTSELGTVAAVQNFAETPAAGIACKRGDRLRIRIYGDDAGTMGTGFTFTLNYSSSAGTGNGDTWFQLTETLTFAAEPAGTQVFLTDTTSAVATAANDLEAWTTRGAGVQTGVTNTVAGFTAPIQVTGTAGGTVVDWFTRPLTAFTLGGAVRVNARGFESNVSANASLRCEIAVVAGDGSGPVVWAVGGSGVPFELSAVSEQAHSFLVAGSDTAITAGQRLRIRFYIDDAVGTTGAAMGTGFTATLYYAGASGATGDTFLTFTQTLTEYVPYVPRNPGVNFQNPGVL